VVDATGLVRVDKKMFLILVIVSLVWSSFGRPEGKKPRGRARRRCKDNDKIDLQEVGWEGMDWIDVAQDKDRCM
jgi:hypothetical protein